MNKLLFATSAYCNVCYDLVTENVPKMVFFHASGTDEFRLFKVKLSALRSKVSICPICTSIYYAISLLCTDPEFINERDICVDIIGYGALKKPLLLFLTHTKMSDGAGISQLADTREERLRLHLPLFGIEVYTLAGHPNPCPELGVSTNLVANPQSEKCFTAIKGWIHECLDSHPLCKTNSTRILPKRVIDVGPADGSKEPCLYISKGESCEYVTLSHCWGKSQIITTTKATIESRVNGIRLEELSKTFRDAILVTRGLGQKYLWIDSLCIVQDDKEDWETESAKMGQIYEMSYVTIAATDASDGSKGFLSPRPTLPLSTSGVYARKHVDVEQFNDGRSGSRGKSPRYALLERAWCFQERILAARVIHYTDAGIIYECASGCRTELEQDLQTSLKANYASAIHEYVELGDSATKHDQCVLWGKVLRDYTSKKLTFQSDVLPALSAVAAKMQSYGMGKYLAGLWERDLVFELLWISREDPDPDYDASNVSGSDHDLDSWFGASNNGEESDDGDPEADDSEEEKSEGDESEEKEAEEQGPEKKASEEKEAEEKEAEEKETEKGDGEELTDEHLETQILEASKSTNGDEKVKTSPFARPATYLAPTFSWASRVGPIKTFFADRAYTLFVDSIEATCTPKGLDPLGQVSNGSIKVVGRITEAKFHPKACIDDLCQKLFEVEGGSHAHNTFNIAYAVNPRCHLFKRGFFPQNFTVDSEEAARTPKGETVYCLLVLIEHEPYEEEEKEESEGGGEEGDEEKNEGQDNDKNEEEAGGGDNNEGGGIGGGGAGEDEEEETSEGGGREGDEEENEDEDNDKNEDGEEAREEAKDEDNNKEDEIEDDDPFKDLEVGSDYYEHDDADKDGEVGSDYYEHDDADEDEEDEDEEDKEVKKDEDDNDEYDDILNGGKAAVLILRRSPDGEEHYTRIGASRDFPVAFFLDAVEKGITIL